MAYNNFGTYVREAYHAGNWYTNSGIALRNQITSSIQRAATELNQMNPASVTLSKDGIDAPRINSLLRMFEPSNENLGRCKIAAIYGPHAGLNFSAWTNGHVYNLAQRCLANEWSKHSPGVGPEHLIKYIFMLGPSHHKSLDLEVSGASCYQLPWGGGGGSNNSTEVEVRMPCDGRILQEVFETCRSKGIYANIMTKRTDEEEHCLEMHLPFVVNLVEQMGGLFPVQPATNNKVLTSSISLIPMLIGNLGDAEIKLLADNVLIKYFNRPDVLFIFSTDFCHWGERFGYTYRYKPQQYPVISEGIKAMDLEGQLHLSKKDPVSWKRYLKETQNTICGRYPLTIMIQLIHDLERKAAANLPGSPAAIDVIPVHYSQSNAVTSTHDGSVSYASGIVSILSKLS